MILEDIIVCADSKYPLNGILTIPESDHPVPAVVFVHGSGASDKDEKIGGLTPFKDLAEGLAEFGIASLRYDKRSFTHGFKMLRDKNLEVTVKSETIDDAIAASELLKKDCRIDAENVFVIGHSMGAMLAPRIDAEGGQFKGLILMAGSPRRLEEIMMGQNEAVRSQTKGLVHWIVEKQIAKLTKQFEGLYEMSDAQAKAVKMGNGVTLYYFKEMGEHQASDYLMELEKPILILQGEKDFQATVKDDYSQYQMLLEGKDNVTFHLYEGLNHAFVSAISENIMMANQEYKPRRNVNAKVIEDIAMWIKGISK